MDFNEEMRAKQANKDKACKLRVNNYLNTGKADKACKLCNNWKHKDFTMTCIKHSRDVFLNGI